MVEVAGTESTPKHPKKPLILCDVGGTLLLDEGDSYSEKPNQELITLLNHAKAQGFEVRLITGGYDSGTWHYDRDKLQKTNLDPKIIRNVSGKENINPSTYSNVVAIIDDDKDSYIGDVIKGNAGARHFSPTDIEELTRYLARIKSRRTEIS